MADMNKMMQQARQMQERMAEVQEEVKKLEKTYTAGDAVKVTARGDHTITKIEIAPSSVDPEDVEGLEDLVLTAVNGAQREIQETTKNKMSDATGGIDLSQLGF